MPPRIIQIANRYKRALAYRDHSAREQMAGQWAGIMRGMNGEIDKIARTMVARRAAGLAITPGYLYRTERYQTLLRQANSEFQKYDEFAAGIIANNVVEFRQLARQHALGLLDVIEPGIAGGFYKLPTREIETIAGFVSENSPLRNLLAEAWPDAVAQTTNALVTGVGLGYGPRKIAKMMRDGMTGGVNRSMVIARTEPHRAYRDVKLETWRAIPSVVGFQRVATHDKRTCPACLFADGRFIEIDEEFAEHPQGRCIAIPVTRRSGLHKFETGQEWFERQSTETQRGILGKGRFAAWERGDFDLVDIPAVKSNSVWGDSLRARGLKELLRGEFAPYEPKLPRGLIPKEPPPAPLPTAPEPPSLPIPDVGYWNPLESPIEDAQTIGELQDWAMARYPHIEFDFTEANIDAMMPTIRQFDKLAQQYPEVAARLKYVGTYQNPFSNYNSYKNAFSPNTFAHASTDGERLGLNHMRYNDAKALERAILDCVDSGWLTGDGSIESMMSHEFGHHVENWLLSQPSKRAFMEYASGDGFGGVRETVQLFNKKFSPTATLSKYATTTNTLASAPARSSFENKVEGWAEAFSAINHKPKKEWPAYVKKINNLLNEVADPSKWRDDATYISSSLRMGDPDEFERGKEAIAAARKRLGMEN